jgi:hypothetical protein
MPIQMEKYNPARPPRQAKGRAHRRITEVVRTGLLCPPGAFERIGKTNGLLVPPPPAAPSPVLRRRPLPLQCPQRAVARVECGATRLWLVLDRRRRRGEDSAAGVHWGVGLGKGDLGRLRGRISNGISKAQRRETPLRCAHVAYKTPRHVVGLVAPGEYFLATTGWRNGERDGRQLEMM